MAVSELSPLAPEPSSTAHLVDRMSKTHDSPPRLPRSQDDTIDDSSTAAEAGAALSAFLVQMHGAEDGSSASETDGVMVTDARRHDEDRAASRGPDDVPPEPVVGPSGPAEEEASLPVRDARAAIDPPARAALPRTPRGTGIAIDDGSTPVEAGAALSAFLVQTRVGAAALAGSDPAPASAAEAKSLRNATARETQRPVAAIIGERRPMGSAQDAAPANVPISTDAISPVADAASVTTPESTGPMAGNFAPPGIGSARQGAIAVDEGSTPAEAGAALSAFLVQTRSGAATANPDPERPTVDKVPNGATSPVRRLETSSISEPRDAERARGTDSATLFEGVRAGGLAPPTTPSERGEAGGNTGSDTPLAAPVPKEAQRRTVSAPVDAPARNLTGAEGNEAGRLPPDVLSGAKIDADRATTGRPVVAGLATGDGSPPPLPRGTGATVVERAAADAADGRTFTIRHAEALPKAPVRADAQESVAGQALDRSSAEVGTTMFPQVAPAPGADESARPASAAPLRDPSEIGSSPLRSVVSTASPDDGTAAGQDQPRTDPAGLSAPDSARDVSGDIGLAAAASGAATIPSPFAASLAAAVATPAPVRPADTLFRTTGARVAPIEPIAASDLSTSTHGQPRNSLLRKAQTAYATTDADVEVPSGETI